MQYNNLACGGFTHFLLVSQFLSRNKKIYLTKIKSYGSSLTPLTFKEARRYALFAYSPWFIWQLEQIKLVSGKHGEGRGLGVRGAREMQFIVVWKGRERTGTERAIGTENRLGKRLSNCLNRSTKPPEKPWNAWEKPLSYDSRRTLHSPTLPPLR